MSAKHTPGPWSLATVPTSCGVCHKVGPFPGKRPGEPKRHACLYADYPSPGNDADAELLANARLISAAPDLLGALQAVINSVPFHHSHKDVHDRALAAIAKATGSTT